MSLALVTQHAKHTRRIILSSVPGLVLHYFVNETIFAKNLWNMQFDFLFFLQLLYKIFHIPKGGERDMIVNVCMSSCKVPVILIRF